ncbi:MAG: hypothetical protein ABSB15_28735 [Bryobacteraceae bacterium]
MALEKYVRPAIRAGKASFSVAVRDLMEDLQAEGFPARNWPQVCTAIQAEKFLRAHGLVIEGVDGPPKKLSTTVVIRYRVEHSEAESGSIGPHAKTGPQPKVDQIGSEETPEVWAHRMTGKLFGLMKDEIAALGGGEAFLRWVRGYDEEDAP